MLWCWLYVVCNKTAINSNTSPHPHLYSLSPQPFAPPRLTTHLPTNLSASLASFSVASLYFLFFAWDENWTRCDNKLNKKKRNHFIVFGLIYWLIVTFSVFLFMTVNLQLFYTKSSILFIYNFQILTSLNNCYTQDTFYHKYSNNHLIKITDGFCAKWI